MGGNRPLVLAGERDWLLVRLTQKPDPTLHALLAELRQRGVTLPAIRHGVFCGGKGSASKENVFAEEQVRPEVARRRHGWMRYQKRINPDPSGVHRRDPGTRTLGLPIISGPRRRKARQRPAR